MKWNIAKVGSRKAKALLALCWLVNPSQYLPHKLGYMEHCRVGHETNWVKFTWFRP